MRLILFKQVDYRDNDLIVNGLDENDRRVSFLIRGAKKAGSKSAAYSVLGNIYDFICDDEDYHQMHRFKGGDLVKSNHHIMDSLLKIAVFNCLLELVEKLCQDDEITFHGLYKNFSKALQLLDQDDHELLVLGLFMAYACEMLGIKPQVDGCVCCGENRIVALNIEEGGFVCQKHHHQNDELYHDVEALKTFRYLNKAEFANYESLRSLDLDFLCLHCLRKFLKQHGAINLSSYDFLLSIAKSAIN